MDYFTLNRRELQALCKKHGIPANLTNVSMAEALTALLNVDNNKPSDDRFLKQQVTSEDTGDKSVLTDISDNPRQCTKPKRHEVAAEGKSAEEPIVLDDDEAPSALKEIHIKSATKTLKGKGEDRTEKPGSKIRQRKILDKYVDESSDAVTPYISVQMGRGRTCKRGTNAKNPKTRTCYATDTEDAKPLQQKYNSCENEEESDEANNGSIEEVTETRRKILMRKKVDKVEMATEESIIVSTYTEDDKSQQQEHDSCEKRKENEEPKNASVEEVPKARPKRGLSRKKVDKSEQATEESIIVSTHTEDDKSQQQEHDSCEKIKENEEPKNGSVEEVPKARPKRGLSRKKVDKSEQTTEERIQVSIHTEDPKHLKQEHDLCEKEKGSDEANNESVKEVPKARPKGRLSRKKVEEVEMATEGSSNQMSTNTEDAEPLQQEHGSCEQGEGSDEANNGSVEGVTKTRASRRLIRQKVDKVEMVTEERIQESVDANDHSVEVILKTRPKARPSRNRVDKLEEAAEESIQGTNNAKDGCVEEVHENRHQSIRNKFDAVKEAAEANTDGSIGANHSVEEDTGTNDANDESVEVGEATAESKNESVKEVPENMPKAKLSRKIIEEATEENIKWTDDVKDEEISRTKGRSSSRKRSEEADEENIQGVDDEIKDRSPICRRSTRANALKGLDTQPLIKRSLPRRKYNGEDSVKETLRASKRIKKSSDKKVKYDPAETSVKVSAKKHAKKESPKFLVGDSMEGSARKINKEVSNFSQANQTQNSHDSADVKNGGESNPDFDCSVIKQDIISHGRVINEADLAAEGNTGAFEGESMQEGMSIAESPNGAELETLCSQKGRAPPSFKDKEGNAESIKEGMGISERFNVTESKTICAQQGRIPGIKDEESQREDVKIAKSSNGTMSETTCAAQEGEAPGIKDEVSQGESMWEGVSEAESPTGTKTETMCAQEGKAPGIKDEVSQGNSIQEGVNRVESPKGTKTEIMCAQEGKVPGIKGEVSQGESVQKGVGKAESPNETESETMCAQEGKTSGINDEENQRESMQDSRSIAEKPGGIESEVVWGQESESLGIKEEESHGKIVHSTVSIADVIYETEPETMCAQEGKASGINDEENQGAPMQDSRSIAEKPGGIESEVVWGQESESQEGKTSGIKEEESHGESMQDGRNTAESPKGTEPEIMCGQESESLGIKDEESHGKTVHNTVSIADVIYETEPETVCAQEGKASGINDEENQGESIQESEVVWGQESESPGIRLEESQGKTSQKTVSIADSNNETEPETMCPQEGKAPGIKDGESQWGSMQDSMSIAESPNGTEPEIVCGQESESPGIKDEKSKGKTVKQPASTADSNNKTETENMQSPLGEASGGKDEASGGKDETILLNSIQQGISISEGHNQAELGTMHLDPKVGAKPVFSSGETEGKVQFYDDKSYKELPTGLEDEDVFDDIQVDINEDVSETVTSVSIGNGKADMVERLSSLSIDNDNQTDVRVTSSSVQVGNEPKSQKRLASSSAQIDREKRIKDSYSHDVTGSNKSPLAKELIHYKEKQFVPDAIKDEKLNGFSDESGMREEFVPWTPPKEEQHFLVPIDDDQESSHVKQDILALGNTDEEPEVMDALRNTDEESEGMDSQQAFKTDREVEDFGLGNKNPLALQEYEQENTKEFEETLCQDKAPLYMEDTHFHEKTCVPDEQVQLTYGDKLHEEANNNVLLIQKEISPHLACLSLRKLKAMYKDSKTAFKTDREIEHLGLGNKNPLALQEYGQQNTKEFEETICQDKVHISMEDTHFHEKTCVPDEQAQVTYVDKLHHEANNNVLLIQKEISPPLDSLSLRQLKAMYKYRMAMKENRMAKKENCASTHFQEKTCSKDELTWRNKLKNDIKEENCAYLNELIVRKENKVGKRYALHNLSSNDLEERQKGPNKAEKITYGSQQ